MDRDFNLHRVVFILKFNTNKVLFGCMCNSLCRAQYIQRKFRGQNIDFLINYMSLQITYYHLILYHSYPKCYKFGMRDSNVNADKSLENVYTLEDLIYRG